MASSSPSPSHEVEVNVEQQQRGHHHHDLQPPKESQDGEERGGQQQEHIATVPRPPFTEPHGFHLTRKTFGQQGRTY